MKKATKKSSRKLIIGGSLIFASAILLSTGFATWVIGNQNKSTEDKTKVSVDTAQNNSVSLSATIATDDSLDICENATNGGWLEVEGSNTPDFTVTLTDIKITAGSDWISKNTVTSITVAIKDSVAASEGVEGYTNLNSTTVNNIGTNFRTGSSWNYLKLETISITTTNSFNSNVLDFGNQTITFGWGDYFDNKAPTTYYNELHDTGKGGNKLTDAQACIDELNAMHTALDGNSITLVLTINSTENTTSN